MTADAGEGVPIGGLRLRELLVLILAGSRGVWDLAELAEVIAAKGYVVRGRAGKVCSDALRYEVRRGRAIRVGRGRYAAGRVTRQDVHRIRTRLGRLRARHHDAKVRRV